MLLIFLSVKLLIYISSNICGPEDAPIGAFFWLKKIQSPAKRLSICMNAETISKQPNLKSSVNKTSRSPMERHNELAQLETDSEITPKDYIKVYRHYPAKKLWLLAQVRCMYTDKTFFKFSEARSHILANKNSDKYYNLIKESFNETKQIKSI